MLICIEILIATIKIPKALKNHWRTNNFPLFDFFLLNFLRDPFKAHGCACCEPLIDFMFMLTNCTFDTSIPLRSDYNCNLSYNSFCPYLSLNAKRQRDA